MDLPSDLLSHVRDLAESVGDSDDTVNGSLAVLVEDLQAAVSSYMGLRLTLVLDGWPVTLTAFGDIDGQRPVTSLRLALPALDPAFNLQSRIVLYAGRAGAFVDLAADLDYLHRRRRSGHTAYVSDGGVDGHRPAVRLDLDLPPESVVSGITGLEEFGIISRAVGVLINQGHHPDHAHAVLHRAAAQNGLASPDYAAQLLVGQ